jgi:ABC-type multidrug transport system ATPase subunit
MAGRVSQSRILMEVEQLFVRRGGREVLHGVSFCVPGGELLGVIGPNGAGKTTLLECMAGVLPSTRGTIRGAREELFYLPDGIRPWPEQTVEWTIAMIANAFGCEASFEIAKELDLLPLMQQRVKSLSKGEAKRLGIALALATPRPLLLLDEPFDGLDLRQTRALSNLLRRIVAKEQRTLVLSIHQLSDAARVCDRFLLLDHGRLVAAGTLDELRVRSGSPERELEEIFLALT